MTRSRIVVSASSASGRSEGLQWLEPLLGSSEILVIGATRAAADEFARSLPGAGAFGVHRFTLLQLAGVVASRGLARDVLAPLSRLASEATAARISDRLVRSKSLKYFGQVARMPGFAGALASTLSDLRLAEVRPARLAKMGPAASDLSRLLRAYEMELTAGSLADLATVLETAAQSESALFGIPVLFVDAPLDTARHIEFAQAIVRRATSACAILRSADVRTIEAYSQLLGVEPDEPAAERADALGRVRTHVFSPERPPSGDMDGSVEMFAAPGEGLEAVEIVRRIHAIAREGVPFDRIAVLLRNADRYQPFLEEAMRRGRVPAYFSRGASRPAAAGRGFLALLACAVEGCSASRFAEYLSLGEIPELDAAGSPVEAAPMHVPPDDELLAVLGGGGTALVRETEEEAGPAGGAVATPLVWERMLVDAAVVGGRERWARRLRGLENELRLRLDSLGPEEETRRVQLAEDIRRMQALEAFALPLIDLLAVLPKHAKWGEWLDSLDRVARTALRDPEPVLAVLGELEPMADIGPVEIDEVTAVLSDRLRYLRREPPRRRYGRVFVASIEEARAMVFDTVFLPGVAEGLFPQKRFEDPLLLDAARQEIGYGLRTRQDALEEERLLLRTAAGAAEARLIVSYPSMDIGQGRPKVPSFYALEIARAVEGRVPSLRTFEMGARNRAGVKLAWPAPNEAAQAIDEAEYDLANFEQSRGTEGGSAYLTTANAHLIRSLRARFCRWQKSDWREEDGLVKPDTHARAVLQKHLLHERAYSASSLQQFASCPFRFYLHALVHLREKESLSGIEQMDPLTRGALFHAAQHEFFTNVIGREPESLEQALRLAETALDRVESEYREKLAPAIDRVWHTEIEDLRNDLRGWARHWWSDQGEWQTIHSELAFGLADRTGRDPASIESDVPIAGGIGVRGAIDLVEKHRTRGSLRITDHKTGKPPQSLPSCVGGGTVLQPSLYSLAAETMLGSDVESGRLFFCTQQGGFTPVEIRMDATVRQRLGQVLNLIDIAVQDGFFPPAPAKDACKFCEYRMVCGPYEETRFRRKQKSFLDPLNQIRCLP